MASISSALRELDLPPHFNPAMAYESGYQANVPALAVAAEQWRKRYSIRPVSTGEKRIIALDIDDQSDFDFPQGALFVAGRSGTGAMDALLRRVEFIYHYLEIFSELINSMDAHNVFQVFHQIAHLNLAGEHPAFHTMIPADLYRQEYRANPVMAYQLGATPEWLTNQFIFYCDELKRKGKPPLTIWPYHCLLGSSGQRLAGLMEEARIFHSFVRGAVNTIEVKGWLPLVEHYSIIAPEVTETWDGKAIPGAKKNQWLLDEIAGAAKTFIMGEAASHCLPASSDDIFTDLIARDPKLLRNVAVLKDCTTPVVVPGVVDFTDQVERTFQRYQDMGVQVFESTDHDRIEKFVLKD
jgi:nicotinamidase-related amidase